MLGNWKNNGASLEWGGGRGWVTVGGAQSAEMIMEGGWLGKRCGLETQNFGVINL